MTEPEACVYVVMGSTGEYSDRKEWAVMAYRDASAAQAHVEAAETWLRAKRLAPAQSQPDMDEQKALGWLNDDWDFILKNPHDSLMVEPDYTGVRYYILTVPLR